jgi:hypothetical protein
VVSGIQTGPRWGAVLLGSLGVGFGLAAVLVLAGEALFAMQHARWPGLTPRSVMDDTMLRGLVPIALRAWLDRPASGVSLQRPIVWVLDEVPLALFLGGLAVLFIRMALRFERSRDGR